jgi:hypothetical protein
MTLFLRLFTRYAARVGYLDGKRNYPGPQHFLDVPRFGLPTESGDQAPTTEEPQITTPVTLHERRQT